MTYHDDILAYNRQQFSAYIPMLSEENPFEVYTAPRKVHLEANPPHSPRNLARRMRAWLINQYMGRIERRLWDAEEHRPFSAYTLERPVNYAYWHLADMVEDEHAIMQQCDSCQHWFVPTDPRQRFFPPGLDKSGVAVPLVNGCVRSVASGLIKRTMAGSRTEPPSSPKVASPFQFGCRYVMMPISYSARISQNL